jgi:hypothetical protein
LTNAHVAFDPAAALAAGEVPSTEKTVAQIDDLLGKLTASFVIAAVGQDEVSQRTEPADDVLIAREGTDRVKKALAALPERERDEYLATGPFPALTDRTIIQPAALRGELVLVRSQGHAVDDGEIAEGLHCIAAPIRTPDGRVLAAISASRHSRASGALVMPMMSAPIIRWKLASARVENAGPFMQR